ncbi:MAG: hypothetical protein BWY06_02367 [Candidatus Latescibacteria bacterium ADurb.Bin168]|nr:MAG: hypothetical protein BWY06_02367 [Candidatus Latescibacteria bacterium ADurb.Bin168]
MWNRKRPTWLGIWLVATVSVSVQRVQSSPSSGPEFVRVASIPRTPQNDLTFP